VRPVCTEGGRVGVLERDLMQVLFDLRGAACHGPALLGPHAARRRRVRRLRDLRIGNGPPQDHRTRPVSGPSHPARLRIIAPGLP